MLVKTEMVQYDEHHTDGAPTVQFTQPPTNSGMEAWVCDNLAWLDLTCTYQSVLFGAILSGILSSGAKASKSLGAPDPWSGFHSRIRGAITSNDTAPTIRATVPANLDR